jgi:hypothetical protein
MLQKRLLLAQSHAAMRVCLLHLTDCMLTKRFRTYRNKQLLLHDVSATALHTTGHGATGAAATDAHTVFTHH